MLHSRQEAAPTPLATLNLTGVALVTSGGRYTTMDRGDTRLLLAPATPPCHHQHLFLVPSAPANVGLRNRGGLWSEQAQGDGGHS